MGRKRTPGLVRRQGLWHIDKRIGGRRVCQSTGTIKLEEAELFLARQIEESRQAQVYGVRPTRSFELAAVKFVRENQHKRTIRNDIGQLKRLMPWIGSLPLKRLRSMPRYAGASRKRTSRGNKTTIVSVDFIDRDTPLLSRPEHARVHC